MAEATSTLEAETQRQVAVQQTVRRAGRKLHKLSQDVVERSLPQLCFRLIRIAQRHIPAGPLGTCDRTDVTACLKTLQSFGLQPPIEPSYRAAVGTASREIITSSPLYRLLYNQTVACLATIADLAEKSSAPGSIEFQRGVKEGYRRASAIAVQFLTDIQNEVEE